MVQGHLRTSKTRQNQQKMRGKTRAFLPVFVRVFGMESAGRVETHRMNTQKRQRTALKRASSTTKVNAKPKLNRGSSEDLQGTLSAQDARLHNSWFGRGQGLHLRKNVIVRGRGLRQR